MLDVNFKGQKDNFFCSELDQIIEPNSQQFIFFSTYKWAQ
jgi:hypothetical protein